MFLARRVVCLTSSQVIMFQPFRSTDTLNVSETNTENQIRSCLHMFGAEVFGLEIVSWLYSSKVLLNWLPEEQMHSNQERKCGQTEQGIGYNT